MPRFSRQMLAQEAAQPEPVAWPHSPRWWLAEHLMEIHERHIAALGQRLFAGAVVPVIAHR